MFLATSDALLGASVPTVAFIEPRAIRSLLAGMFVDEDIRSDDHPEPLPRDRGRLARDKTGRM